MTTIAWDGETLAADSQATTGCRKSFGESKVISPVIPLTIFGVKITVIGSAGNAGDERHVITYLKAWGEGEEKEMHPEVSCTAIIMTEQGRCFTIQKERDNRLPWVFENTPPYAIGSGADFAITAMHLGKDAAESVKIASELDANTGGAVISYNYLW